MNKPTGKLASACETLAGIGSRIEALLAENDSLRGLYKMHQQTETREMLDLRAERDALLVERDAQQWISVEDRLPDSGLCVLAYYTNSHGKGRRIRAEYVAPKSREVEWEYADPDTQCVEHDEEYDSFYLTAGWYELIDNWEEYTSIAVVEGEVTHWMPLPAAPIALQGEQP